MTDHKTGCLVCGRELKYFDPPITLNCMKCGNNFETGVSCEDGHFICDACHYEDGYALITDMAQHANSKNPVMIAAEMMKSPQIKMHGPEHHYLIIAALLAAYKNSGADVDLPKTLQTAMQRSKNVPGGICGMWGCCGAGVGAGIFISIITGATPLSVEEWSLANKMTSASLDVISKNGGPRCCKRNTFLSIMTAVDFVKEKLGIAMERQETITCSFFRNNPSCRLKECLFFPG